MKNFSENDSSNLNHVAEVNKDYFEYASMSDLNITMKTVVYPAKILMHYGLIISLAFLAQSDFRFRQTRNKLNLNLDTASQKIENQKPENLDTDNFSSSNSNDPNSSNSTIGGELSSAGGELSSAEVNDKPESHSHNPVMADTQQDLAQDTTDGQDDLENREKQQHHKTESGLLANPTPASVMESTSPSESYSSNSVVASQTTTESTDTMSDESEQGTGTEHSFEKTESDIASITDDTLKVNNEVFYENDSEDINQANENIQAGSDELDKNLIVAKSPLNLDEKSNSQSGTSHRTEVADQFSQKSEGLNINTDTNSSELVVESPRSDNSDVRSQPESVTESTTVAETEPEASVITGRPATGLENTGNANSVERASSSGEHQTDDSTYATSYESNQKKKSLDSYGVAEIGPSGIDVKDETGQDKNSPGSLGASLVENASPLPISANQSQTTNLSESDQILNQPVQTPMSSDLQKVLRNGSALALEDETWRSMSLRIYGNADWAEKLWRVNRDRHSGDIEAKIIPGRLVRLIDIENMPNLSRIPSQMASKSH